jgi:predicted ATPase/class 3 adenylate cyclase
METAYAYLPIDRRLALAEGRDLPTAVSGSALDADLSGFTALTETLARQLGEQRGAEELARRLNVMYDGLISCAHRFGATVLSFAGDAFSCWLDGDDGMRAVACGQALQHWMTEHAKTVGDGLPPPRLKVAVATGRTRRFLVGDPNVQLLEGLAGAVVDELAAAGHDAQPGQVVLARSTRASLGDRARTTSGGVLVELTGDVPAVPWPALHELPEHLDRVRPWLLPVVFDRLAAGEGDFLAELRPATALFLHMPGINYEDDPDALDRLDAFIRQVQRVLSAYEGTQLQLTIGDKGSYLYAAFGAPLGHEDDEVRALLAARELRRLGGRGGLVDRVSIGVASGRLRAGSYGGTERRTYGVLGDTVNLAARLMQAAGPGEVVVTRSLREHAGAGFRWAAFDDLTVKGKAQPVPVARLTGIRATVPRSRRHEHNESLPMIGRAAERALLDELLTDARSGQGRIAIVIAEAGMGKSRLVSEFVQDTRRRRIETCQGDCPSYGVNGSYLVWQPIWQRLLGLPERGSMAARTGAARDGLGRGDRGLVGRLPVLAPLLGLTVDDTDFTRSLDAKVRKTSLETTLVEWLRASVTRPLVLVLEDCHWIDPLSEDLLQTVGRAVRDLPVLLIITMRPRGATDGGELPVAGLPHSRTSVLDRLPVEDVERLIRRRLHTTSLPRSLADEVSRLAVRAEGNPFYVEELLDYIIGLGPDAMDPARLAELPSTLQSLVLSRVDRLAERPRSTLKVASAVGRTFAADLLPPVHPELGSDETVRASLETLHRNDFVLPEQPERGIYGFKHAITQEVAYSTITETTRAGLHGRIGRTLEQRAAGNTEQILDLLAHHFGRSDDDDRRRTYVLRAGEAAQSRWANRAAAEYFRNVLPLLESDERGDVLLKLGRALSLTGRLDEAATAFDDAYRTGEERGEVVLSAWAETEQGELARKRGRYDDAQTRFSAARERLSEKGDRAGVAEVLHLEGTLSAQRGATARARESYENSLAIRRQLGDRRGVSRSLNGLGIVAEYENDLIRATTLYAEALQINIEIGDPWGVAALTNNQGYALLLQGRAADALPLFDRAVALQREIGDLSMLANFLSNFGDAWRELGNSERAMEAYEEALLLAREVDERWLVCYLLEDVAMLCAARGQAAAALRLAAAGERLRVAIGSPLPAKSQRLLDARLEAARRTLDPDEHDEAIRVGTGWTFDEAIEHALGAEPSKTTSAQRLP